MPYSLEIMALIDTWARAYRVPREAIIRQIPIAFAWSKSNKNKAPKKNVIRFLFNFMRKAQEFGNLRVPPAAGPQPKDLETDLTYEEAVAIRKQNMGGAR